MLSLILLVIAVWTTLMSFLIKGKLLSKAIEQGQVQQVQQAYVVAWAVTEVGALLGVLDYFMSTQSLLLRSLTDRTVRAVASLSTKRTCRKWII